MECVQCQWVQRSHWEKQTAEEENSKIYNCTREMSQTKVELSQRDPLRDWAALGGVLLMLMIWETPQERKGHFRAEQHEVWLTLPQGRFGEGLGWIWAVDKERSQMMTQGYSHFFNHTRTTPLSNSMKPSHACGATQNGRVMVERPDRMWSTGEGNGKPLQYSSLENPMDSMKGKMIGYQKRNSPGH